jgi:alpha-L-fucosidase
MKKLPILLTIFFMYISLAQAQTDSIHDARMQWWREARFGMFIHWGVYSVPAGMYKGQKINKASEWIMNRGKIPVKEYRKFASQFNPVKYDAEAWVKMAKDAGMKYIVITAKHHDGFAMFGTKASLWNIVNATPYGKDVLKPLAAACKKYGIKLGFYYSQAQDWNNPGGSAAKKATSEGWANPDSSKIDAYTNEHAGHWDSLQTTRPMTEYIEQVSVPQVKELLTKYGDVAILWWDTPVGMTDEYASKLHNLLALQPNIITNDRLKRPNYKGDYKTPEQRIPNLDELEGWDWETCMTMNGSWGYKSYDDKWKSTETLIRNLIDIASKGGNYLLNVGPTAEGEFPHESITRLKEIGEWMHKNGEAIYGTSANPLTPVEWGRCTAKDSAGHTILYFSVFTYPKDGKLLLQELPVNIVSVSLLRDGSALAFTKQSKQFLVDLPQTCPDNIATVIKVVTDGKIEKANSMAKTKMKAGELD